MPDAMTIQALLDDPLILALVGGALLLLLVLLLLQRARRRGSLSARLRRACLDILTDIVVPDGEGGQMHLDYVLLTPEGVVLLDLRDVEGHVFGSNTMQDWTVLAEKRRFTFANPQHALHDRVAVVKRLLPDVRVKGIVAFTSRALFTKGMPEHVVKADDYVEELGAGVSDTEVPGLRDAWDRLRSEAVSAQVGRLMSD
ncbi:MAG: nuclease-related domain-containing protein [Gammaproteobacteria bacterium]